MTTKHVMVDYENVQVSSLSLLKGEEFRVWLFLGPHNKCLKTELAIAMHDMPEQVVPIRMKASGKNALDFHITYYLGKLTIENPDGHFFIISKDTGYDPLIRHLKAKDVHVDRSESIPAMHCFREPKPKKSLLELVIANLEKRGRCKPGKEEGLKNAIREACGKETPESKIESLIRELEEMHYLKVEDKKVQYSGL